MGKTCCVPRCNSGYKNVDMSGITMHSFRPRWKEKIRRGGTWKVTANTGICSKHFVQSDFITSSLDSNERRGRKKDDVSLKKWYIKEDAIPTIFPNCPSYFSKKTPTARPTMASSAIREAVVEERLEEERLKKVEMDTVRSLEDIKKLLSTEYANHNLILKTNSIIKETQITFYAIEVNEKELKPYIKYSLVINHILQFQCFYYNTRIHYDQFEGILKRNEDITYFTEIVEILKTLENMNEEELQEDIKFHIEKLKQFQGIEGFVRSKLDFLVEQIELAFMHVKHRRYSSDLLSMCVLWENSSSNLYKQICEEGVLTIPSPRYVKKLTSAISMDTGLSGETLKYLEARIAKLNDREKVGSLIMDEVYVAKRCEFTRCDGRIYGMEENEPTKTLLTIMFKSVAADYEDVLAMVPLTKIDSGKLNNLFTMVLDAITPTWF